MVDDGEELLSLLRCRFRYFRASHTQPQPWLGIYIPRVKNSRGYRDMLGMTKVFTRKDLCRLRKFTVVDVVNTEYSTCRSDT